MIDAHEAYRIGLVNEIVPSADLIARAEAILNKINANAPVAVKLAIDAVNRGLDTSLAEGLHIEASLFAPVCRHGGQERGRRRVPREAQAEVPGPVTGRT